MDNKCNELYMLKKGIEDLKRELDGLDSSIQAAGQATSNKLAECNKTFEDGLKKVEAAKHQKLSQRDKTWWKTAKAAVKGILLAPLVWIGLVLGSMLVYGLAYSIAFGMNICFKFLGF